MFRYSVAFPANDSLLDRQNESQLDAQKLISVTSLCSVRTRARDVPFALFEASSSSRSPIFQRSVPFTFVASAVGITCAGCGARGMARRRIGVLFGSIGTAPCFGTPGSFS